jgi:hypothetical protein
VIVWRWKSIIEHLAYSCIGHHKHCETEEEILLALVSAVADIDRHVTDLTLFLN